MRNANKAADVQSLPVEIHCHGLSGIDFSDLNRLNFQQINELAHRERIRVVLTVFLERGQVDLFEDTINEFWTQRTAGTLPNLVGFAIEGPVLSSSGGTPKSAAWLPTRHEWSRIGRWGGKGLTYMVLSPDAWSFDTAYSLEVPLEWVIATLIAGGVRLAFGHFSRSDPAQSARAIERAVEVAMSTPTTMRGCRLTTDHLFNDMPQRIVHSFRDTASRRTRDDHARIWRLDEWEQIDLTQAIGDVPAALIVLAKRGKLAVMINFDGDHVDRELAVATARFVGMDNVCLMTDRCGTDTLAGTKLRRCQENSLLYQSEGVVAAGSKSVRKQISELRIGNHLTDDEIDALSRRSPARVLGIDGSPTQSVLSVQSTVAGGVLP